MGPGVWNCVFVDCVGFFGRESGRFDGRIVYGGAEMMVDFVVVRSYR